MTVQCLVKFGEKQNVELKSGLADHRPFQDQCVSEICSKYQMTVCDIDIS